MQQGGYDRGPDDHGCQHHDGAEELDRPDGSEGASSRGDSSQCAAVISAAHDREDASGWRWTCSSEARE